MEIAVATHLSARQRIAPKSASFGLLNIHVFCLASLRASTAGKRGIDTTIDTVRSGIVPANWFDSVARVRREYFEVQTLGCPRTFLHSIMKYLQESGFCISKPSETGRAGAIYNLRPRVRSIFRNARIQTLERGTTASSSPFFRRPVPSSRSRPTRARRRRGSHPSH